MARRSLLSIAVLLIVSVASSVQASIVELTFSGTYEGEITGAFSYSMTYDTSLDTNTDFFPTGADLDGATATHDMHAYSASGITDLDLQFFDFVNLDVLEWLLSDLEPVGGAALWFDVDLATGATPTRAFFDFVSGDGLLYIGRGEPYDITPGAEIETANGFGSTNDLTITRSDPDPIPEPASVITWTLLGVVGCIATWWKRRR